MKEELVNTFAEEMLKLLQNAEAFASAQLPEICKEVLWYNGCICAVYLVGFPLLCVGSYKFGRWLYFKCNESDDVLFGGSLVGSIGGAIGCVGWIFALADFIKIICAPRLYLLEYFAGLVSK